MTDKLLEAILGAKGVVAVLVAVLVTGYYEIWIWGKTYRAHVSDLSHERDRWQMLALSTTSLARESAQIALTQKQKD